MRAGKTETNVPFCEIYFLISDAMKEIQSARFLKAQRFGDVFWCSSKNYIESYKQCQVPVGSQSDIQYICHGEVEENESRTGHRRNLIAMHEHSVRKATIFSTMIRSKPDLCFLGKCVPAGELKRYETVRHIDQTNTGVAARFTLLIHLIAGRYLNIYKKKRCIPSCL